MTTWVDPVHEVKGKWYFWDETWSFEEGPYNTEQECRDALDKYAKDCL